MYALEQSANEAKRTMGGRALAPATVLGNMEGAHRTRGVSPFAQSAPLRVITARSQWHGHVCN